MVMRRRLVESACDAIGITLAFCLLVCLAPVLLVAIACTDSKVENI